jgi:hypothetical protein
MDVLARIRAAGRQIDFGVATTARERAAVMAQRFRVYQRSGYYRPGVTTDRDDYDRNAIYVLGVLRDGSGSPVLVGSARVVPGGADESFRFPMEKAFQFAVPDAIRKFPMPEREEVTRFVSERPEGVVLGALVTPLGLIQAISEYSQRARLRCGIAMIKQRLLRALLGRGVPFHHIANTAMIYPRDGIVSAYFYTHPDPVMPVYWLTDELVAPVARAIARYVDRERQPELTT